MTKLTGLSIVVIAAVALIAPATPAVAQSSITCGPLDNGRVANVIYKSNAVFFDPVVEYEYELAVLTVAGPCETLTKTFKAGEEIFFDLAEVERMLDGQYEWELRFMPAVDSGVRKELTASRGSGEEDDLWWNYWQQGAIPDGASVDSAGFMVVKGSIIDPNSDEERQKSATVATKGASTPLAAATAGFEASGGTSSQEASGSGEGGNALATKDTVLTNADGVIRNSLCVGFDCLNNNTYSDSTILLTENNTRIKFEDTSTASSFPRRDWEIQANSNANGGGSWLAINDCGESSGGGCADDPVFLVEANSPANSIRVDSSGRVGFGTSNPIVELHTTSGDTPTLRLDQNTSSGFAAQVWDIAGNETSFFVRDATNGSTLPFRIRPGASSNSLVIDSDDDVGVGTLSPTSALHVRRTGASATSFLVENTNSTPQVVSMVLDNTASSLGSWEFRVGGNGNLFINDTDATGQVMRFVAATGEVVVPGDLTVDGTFSNPSSRTLKTDIEPVDPAEVLQRVVSLPINKWTYSEDASKRRHIGPFSEDFGNLFGLGTKGKNIIPMDVQGVTIAALQGLYQTVQTLEEENSKLLQRLERLEKLLARPSGSTE